MRGGLSSGYPLYTKFAWGQNLKPGQPVLLAGVNVGAVADVQLRDDGYLDVFLRVNNDVKVPRNSVASVKPIGIFGDAAIALTPTGPSKRLLRPERHRAGGHGARRTSRRSRTRWTPSPARCTRWCGR